VIEVEVSNRQTALEVDAAELCAIAEGILREEGIVSGEISIAVVDDPQIHTLNRQYLDHDYETDVLSFVLSHEQDHLIGEVIISADTAIGRCREFDWSPRQELTLYMIHGCLHLVGYRDKSDADQRVMRERENHYLDRFRLRPQATARKEGGEP